MEEKQAHTYIVDRHDQFAGRVRFNLPLTDRFNHCYAAGQTGTGKTTFLKHLATQDIQAGHGLAFIDPHGDAAQELLDYIPADRINDVVYFNPADRAHALGFNIMQAPREAERDRITQEIVGTFRYLWADSWGARMDYIFKNTVRALLDNPARYGSTLLGVPRMFSDPRFRGLILRHVRNSEVLRFWRVEFPNWSNRQQSEYVLPITNKVGQFLLSDTLRRILGQDKSTIDLSYIMDNRKILIVNLDKGQVGADDANILGSLLVTGFQLAAMRRSATPEAERVPFMLYLDEFPSFATSSFASILSETRKHKMGLVIASQYLSQMKKDVREAVFGNCGTIISFRVGGDDADHLAKQLDKPAKALTDLNRGEVAVRSFVREGLSDTFFAESPLPSTDDYCGYGASIIRHSNDRFTTSADVIDKRHTKWLTNTNNNLRCAKN